MYAETSGPADTVIATTATLTTMIQKRFTTEPLTKGSPIVPSKSAICSAQERFTENTVSVVKRQEFSTARGKKYGTDWRLEL